MLPVFIYYHVQVLMGGRLSTTIKGGYLPWLMGMISTSPLSWDFVSVEFPLYFCRPTDPFLLIHSHLKGEKGSHKNTCPEFLLGGYLNFRQATTQYKYPHSTKTIRSRLIHKTFETKQIDPRTTKESVQ